MAFEREYTSRRQAISVALAGAIKAINGRAPFKSNVAHVEPRLRFFDEVQDFPYVSVSAGPETREYQGGGYRNRFLSVTVRVYVNSENPVDQLEALIEDIETVLEESGQIQYRDRDGNTHTVLQIKIISIDTDEGVLAPLGAGEIICEVQY